MPVPRLVLAPRQHDWAPDDLRIVTDVLSQIKLIGASLPGRNYYAAGSAFLDIRQQPGEHGVIAFGGPLGSQEAEYHLADTTHFQRSPTAQQTAHFADGDGLARQGMPQVLRLGRRGGLCNGLERSQTAA